MKTRSQRGQLIRKELEGRRRSRGRTLLSADNAHSSRQDQAIRQGDRASERSRPDDEKNENAASEKPQTLRTRSRPQRPQKTGKSTVPERAALTSRYEKGEPSMDPAQGGDYEEPLKESGLPTSKSMSYSFDTSHSDGDNAAETFASASASSSRRKRKDREESSATVEAFNRDQFSKQKNDYKQDNEYEESLKDSGRHISRTMASSLDTARSELQDESMVREAIAASSRKRQKEDFVPIREIHTTIMNDRMGHSDKDRNLSTLDEATFDTVLSVVNSGEVNYVQKLDEEEIISFMLRMDRVATAQALHYQTFIGDTDHIVESLYEEVLEEEEEYALGQDFFKAIVAKCQEVHKDITLDRKTLHWIRRSAKLNRTSGDSNAKDRFSKGGKWVAKRLTRGMAQSSRVRIQEKGLDILSNALEEVEREIGPFEQTIPRHLRREEVVDPLSTRDVQRKGTTLPLGDGQQTKKRKKGSPTIFFNALQPIVLPAPMKTKERPLKRKRGQQQVSLRTLDENSYSQFSALYGAASKEAGLIDRLPQWVDVRKDDPLRREPFDSPRAAHAKQVYPALIMNLLQGIGDRARFFARCEFFYADLDVAWYGRDSFAEAAEGLGVPPSAQLTRLEWKAIRRRLRRRPRLFSRRFIRSQLKERNMYRNMIRMLQRNPLLSSRMGFDYDVPAPVEIGKTVSAYNSRFRMIQRGIVLSYDYNSATYLIQFEARQFGCEVCPDSEVAKHGGPDILIRSARNRSVRDMFLLSSRQPLAVFDGRHGLGPSTGQPNGKEASGLPSDAPPLTASIEQESFLTLMKFAEAAVVRKEKLLYALDQMISCISSEKRRANNWSILSSNQVNELLRWVQDNLKYANDAVDAATKYMRLLYGKIYLPSKGKVNTQKPGRRNSFIGNLPSETDLGLASSCAVATNWTEVLASESARIADKVSNIILKEANSGDPEDAHGANPLNAFLGSLSEILLSASVSSRQVTEDAAIPSIVSLALCYEKFCAHHTPTIVVNNDLYAETLVAREKGAKELSDALDELFAELHMSVRKQEDPCTIEE